jgi:ribosome-interacting GTPase 1
MENKIIMKRVKLFEAFVNEGKSVLDLKKVQKEITKKCKEVDGVEITKGNKLTGIKELEIKSDWITSLKVKSDGNIYTDDSLSAVGGSVKSESELYKFVNQVIQQEVDYHKQITEKSVNESYNISAVKKGDTFYDSMQDEYKVVSVSRSHVELEPQTFKGDNSRFPEDFGEGVQIEDFWDHFSKKSDVKTKTKG